MSYLDDVPMKTLFWYIQHIRTYAVITYLFTPSPSATLLPLPEGEGWGEGAKRANFGEMRKSCSQSCER